MLTGESLPLEKQADPTAAPESPLALPSCAFMGTVVQEGSGQAVVVETGLNTQFGAIAGRLGEAQPETGFQVGLRDYSKLLVMAYRCLDLDHGHRDPGREPAPRPPRDRIDPVCLFDRRGADAATALVIVTVSLSTGARRLAKRKVVVKRLVAIEDLGDIDVFFTDKTRTLTQGSHHRLGGAGLHWEHSDAVLRDGLACNEAVVSDGKAVGGNPLDRALWRAPGAARVAVGGAKRLDVRQPATIHEMPILTRRLT